MSVAEFKKLGIIRKTLCLFGDSIRSIAESSNLGIIRKEIFVWRFYFVVEV